MCLKYLTKSLPAALSLALVAAACGSSDGDSDVLPLGNLASKVSEAFCAKAYECCNSEELEDFQGELFANEAGCRLYYSGGIETYMVTPMRNAIADGRGEYYPDKARDCLDAYNAMGCVGSNDPQDFFENCETPYVGLQSTGEECNTKFECEYGHYCSTNTKTCELYVDENGACGGNVEPFCKADLYCDGISATCLPKRPVDSDCTYDYECDYGLTCSDTDDICIEVEPVCTGK